MLLDMPQKQYYLNCVKSTSGISHLRPGRVEAHFGKNLKHNRDPEQAYEPHILPDIPKSEPPASMLVTIPSLVQLLSHPRPGKNSAKLDTLSHQADHLTEEEDNHNQVMLSANKFDKYSELSESLVVNGDDPSHATLEGEEANILECIC